MRVVADSHAIVWYVQGSSRLSETGSSALAESERTEGIVVSLAALVDLWYVTQTTRSIAADDLTRLQAKLDASANVDLHVIDVAVADAFTLIPRSVLIDPWDRFIVATAKALALPLVTRDGAIQESNLVRDHLVAGGCLQPSVAVGRSGVTVAGGRAINSPKAFGMATSRSLVRCW